ncbi:UNKNOWN [Stylonychia lemnae]|uniref:GT44 domain-containing protein n=1 Tax=Stylonychia lemnae TaxID=5949 RepID=A0A078AAV0_STYLE|nr:UNKNOWN [Stylonychia lemnae]|eukprot:CDW77918.1 UNKNOWN [Stylonychia lemnae]
MNCFIFEDSNQVLERLTFTQKLTLSTLNFLDFCLFPKTPYYGTEYITERGLLRQIMKDEKINGTLKKHSNHIRRFADPKIFESDQILYKKNNSAEQEGYQWIHYLWVQNKHIIPKTVTLFQNLGVIVREIEELKYFNDEKIQKQYQYYICDIEAIAAASDLIRIVAVLEFGGIYFDNDLTIWKWNYDIHYYFDFFGQYFKILRTLKGISNSFIAAKPGHVILEKYLHYMVSQFKTHEKGIEDRPFYQNLCSYKTVASTIHGTGPTVFTTISFNYLNTEGNQDVLIMSTGGPPHQVHINTIDNQGTQGRLMINVEMEDRTTNLWRNDLIDGSVFGFPELNDFQ